MSLEAVQFHFSEKEKVDNPFFARIHFNVDSPELRALLQQGVVSGINGSDIFKETRLCKGDVFDLNVYGNLGSLRELTAVLKAQTQALNTLYPETMARTDLYVAPTDLGVGSVGYQDMWGSTQAGLLVLNNDFVSTVRAKQHRQDNGMDGLRNGSDVRTFWTANGASQYEFDQWVTRHRCKHDFDYRYQEGPAQASRIMGEMYMRAIQYMSEFKLMEGPHESFPENPVYLNADLNGGTIKALDQNQKTGKEKVKEKEFNPRSSFDTYIAIEEIFNRRNCDLRPVYYDEESATWIGEASLVSAVFKANPREIIEALKLHDFKLTAMRIGKPKMWRNNSTGETIPVFDLDHQLEKALENEAKTNGKNLAHSLAN